MSVYCYSSRVWLLDLGDMQENKYTARYHGFVFEVMFKCMRVVVAGICVCVVCCVCVCVKWVVLCCVVLCVCVCASGGESEECGCVCVCVCEREREREIQTYKQTYRDRQMRQQICR